MMKLLLFIFFLFSFVGMEGSGIMLFFYVSAYMVLCFYMLLSYSMGLGMDHWILISGYFSFDSYSYYLILLSIWILSLMSMSLSGESSVGVKFIVFNLVLFLLVSFFSVFNFMMMYFFFEVSLIPTFLIVIVWGGYQERVEASFFLIIYMMFISFPFLAYLIKVYFYNFSFDLSLNSMSEFNEFKEIMSGWEILIFLGVFLIKLPVYLFHIWLPKAHVEAPVYGSMLLAAILLKLGGYGLLRVTVMFLEQSILLSGEMVVLGLIGSIYISLVCLVQVDMKSLVAYSSVVHMNFMLSSLFTLTGMGFISTFLVMVSHGLSSSGLFFMVNLIYKRSFSRSIVLNRGILMLMPSLGVWWFLLCSSNFAFPFSLNFMGEVMMIMVLESWSLMSVFMLGLISFFSGAYSLYLFSVVYHGGLIEDKGGLINLNFSDEKVGENMIEYLNLFMHYYPLLFVLFNLCLFMY